MPTFPPLSRQILIVDDDAVSRMALAGLLERLPDVDIVEADDGEVAWNLFQKGLRPALCCTDIRMPGLDGLGLLQRIRAHPDLANLPIVMITGDADRASLQQALAQRADGYIIKPFTGPDTRAAVERLLRRGEAAA